MISVNKRFATVAVVSLALLAAACSSDDAKPSTTKPDGGSGAVGEVTTEGISADRCEANKAAGKITYLSSFSFSASASILDVVVAKEKGYFEQMCLDVELRPGFSTTNYPLVAKNEAQFSSAGNYTEILNFTTEGAEFVATVDYGKAPIEALVTKESGATELSQLKGGTIGIKGDLPPSIVAMLAKNGLVRGKDYEELSLEGFDPVVQLEQPIDALPVYKSNEPGQLDAAGVKYHLFDPVTFDVPGSFGLIYTSKQFLADHPTAVEDFTRAALHGMEDAIADPAAAVDIAVAQIESAGNDFFLTKEGELYRWTQESKVVVASTPSGEPVGLIDPALLDTEVKEYTEAGVWPKGAPTDGKYYDADIAKSLYDANGKVIWPAS